MTTAIYPGSFDPITCGHINLIERGLRVFDRLVVAVANNPGKRALFSNTERLELIREVLDHDRIELDSFDGLLVDYAQTRPDAVILRGLRAISDFEFEFQLAHMNRRLGKQSDGDPHDFGVETVFMMTGEEHFYVSSSLVREIAQFGGKLDGPIPDAVADALRHKFSAHSDQSS